MSPNDEIIVEVTVVEATSLVVDVVLPPSPLPSTIDVIVSGGITVIDIDSTAVGVASVEVASYIVDVIVPPPIAPSVDVLVTNRLINVDVGSVGGVQGPPGPQGPQGAQGMPGTNGTNGAQGPQGNPGPAGPQGDVGAQGPAGPYGPPGPQGNQGTQGDPGDKGDKGDPGSYGPPGPDGPMGPQGEVGPPGADGAPGVDGAPGADGPQGPIGPQGDPGDMGIPGDVGPQGPKGDTGPAGADGAAGPQGIQGIQGPIGNTGNTGPQGNPGPANSLAIGTVTTGAPGSAAASSVTGTPPAQTLNLTIPRGDVGAQGIQGVKGDTGAQGAPGTPGISDAPNDASAYVRSGLAWVIGYTKAAIDTLLAGKVAKAGDTMTGNLTIANPSSSQLILSKAAGAFYNIILGTTAGSTRWQIIPGDSSAESGANVGSDFVINRYSDAAAFIDSPMRIPRSTGKMALSVVPTIPAPAVGTDAANKTYVDAAVSPVGSIVYVPATTAPANYLKLNGALLNRVSYAALWTYAQASGNIAASDAAWTGNEGSFSPGDGSTTFRIPDDRGVFPRGWDDGRGIDAGRVIGAFQGDLFASHTHTGNALGVHGHTTATSTAYSGGVPGILNTSVTNGQITGTQTHAAESISAGTPSVQVTGGVETRGKNHARLACIRYQ